MTENNGIKIPSPFLSYQPLNSIIIQLVVIYFLANLAEMAIHTLPQLYVIIRIISGKSFLWFCFCKYKSFYFSQYKYHSKKLAFIKIESFLRIIYELQLKILPSRWNEKHKQPTDTRLTYMFLIRGII